MKQIEQSESTTKYGIYFTVEFLEVFGRLAESSPLEIRDFQFQRRGANV